MPEQDIPLRRRILNWCVPDSALTWSDEVKIGPMEPATLTRP